MLFRKYSLLAFIGFLSLSGALAQPKNEVPPRKRRADCWFGLHFDFHAAKSNAKIGETLTVGMLDSVLATVRPDYVQVDCKGHPGISSYPTSVGNRAAGYVKDPLRLWRDVTAKHGVALYVHYSGVIDQEAIRQHPDWAIINAEGKPEHRPTSLHSPYADNLMIPQLKELITEYGIDGAWIDGECWSLVPDYSEASRQKFAQATGLTGLPRSPDDPNYKKFLEFNRQAFRQYLNHYVDELHQFNPRFELTSNWAFSSYMPEPVTVNLDFLSGDLAAMNSVNSAAFEARVLAPQGKSWDLMAWSFSKQRDGGTSAKTPVQLHQEAAQIMAVGGGFESYFKQNPDASIQPWTIPAMKSIADFARARQPYCQKASAIPQIALLFSNAGWQHRTGNVYRHGDGVLKPMQGILTALLDGQHTVEVLMEHHLRGRMGEYGLIVIPEWAYLEPAFKGELVEYAHQGGKLLVVGAEAIKLFEKESGVTVSAPLEEKKNQWIGFDKQIFGMVGAYQPVTLNPGTQALGSMYSRQDLRFPAGALGSVAACGRGKMAGIAMNFGVSYHESQTAAGRDLLSKAVKELFTHPVVEVKGSHLVHVTLNRLGNKTTINLVNTGGPHANPNVLSYSEVPPVGPLDVRIRYARKPAKVMLQPENKALDFRYDRGQIVLTVPRVDIHSIVVIE